MNPVNIPYPFGDDSATATLYYGQDNRKSLRLLADKSVHTVCTSPPYWGLRDYGLEPSVWGGAEDCDHDFESSERGWNNRHAVAMAMGEEGTEKGGKTNHRSFKLKDSVCTKCGAWLGQLGLEPTPDLFIDHLVMVFDEIRRVLRDDGTIWVNLGDSYFSTTKGSGGTNPETSPMQSSKGRDNFQKFDPIRVHAGDTGIKAKDLVGIPWMFAFAMRKAGWYLRSDIIWHKPNPMPESVTDRPTKSHEYVFLLSKSDKYFYDADAIRENHSLESVARVQRTHHTDDHKWAKGPGDQSIANDLSQALHPNGRNKRSVWTVTTKSYRGAHFATWPLDLVEPMILAGCPEGGTVLDPFSGSATTGLVALKNKRHYIGLDASKDYLKLATARVQEMPPPAKIDGEPEDFVPY